MIGLIYYGQSFFGTLIMYKKFIYLFVSLFYCQQIYAGGVSLGATRLIYPTNQEQVTLKIYNSDDTGNYLVQSWVSDENGDKNTDFIITPPLFVIKSNNDNILKVVYTGSKDDLPKKQEKLYYFNAKVIPSLTEEENNADNALLISTTTKIKLLVRPDSIKDDSFESYKKLKCSYLNNTIKIENPTPFYMNLVSLSINNQEVSKSETIPPKESIYLNVKSKENNLSFNFINDYGVQIKNEQCKF